MANIPENKKQISITLPKDLLEIIQQKADSNYIKLSQQITRDLVDLYKEQLGT